MQEHRRYHLTNQHTFLEDLNKCNDALFENAQIHQNQHKHHHRRHKSQSKKRRSLTNLMPDSLSTNESSRPFKIHQKNPNGIHHIAYRGPISKHLILTKPYWPWP